MFNRFRYKTIKFPVFMEVPRTIRQNISEISKNSKSLKEI